MIYPTTASEGQTVYCGYPNDATREIDNLRLPFNGLNDALDNIGVVKDEMRPTSCLNK